MAIQVRQCMASASKVSEVVIDYVASLCACMSVKVLSDCMRLQSWMAEAICAVKGKS